MTAALDKNPAAEQQQRLRMQLGNAYLLKKDAAGAMKEALAGAGEREQPDAAGGVPGEGEGADAEEGLG